MTRAPESGIRSPASEAAAHLSELIRIPSVNPPGLPDGAAGRDSTGGELAAARYCAEVLTAAGIEARVFESVPGRGSCVARLTASPAVRHAEPPLVLLGHLDVVPVDEEAWTRDPFGGEVVDAVIWGRGAVDMKDMVAMELAVMTDLRRRGVELRRDVIFAAVADEEAGGEHGAGFLVGEHAAQLCASDGRPAAAALNEVGGYSLTLGDRRFYTIQVAEKGIAWTRLRATGTPGHASMPDADNAAVKVGRAVARLAAAPRPARLHPVVAQFLSTLGLHEVAAAAAGDSEAVPAALERAVADPILRRSLDAMLRDTVTPTVLNAGKKVNVLPATAEAEIDVRTLPGTDQPALLDELRALAADDAQVESVLRLPPVEWPADAPIVQLMRAALHRADPEATPVPTMITPGTDAKHLMRLGIPTYGFAPLRLGPETPFLSLFHAHDERLPVSALEFGVPVLTEVVERFCAVEPGAEGG